MACVSGIERGAVRQERAGRGDPLRERTDRRRRRSPQGQRITVHGDHYVAALPLEDIAPLVSDRLAAADPTLANLRALAPNLEWMNGVQFYLHRAVPSAHGHVIHIDTEWALTSISQLQFWRDVPSELFGDSDVHGILSVDISDWTAPGSERTPGHAVLA